MRPVAAPGWQSERLMMKSRSSIVGILAVTVMAAAMANSRERPKQSGKGRKYAASDGGASVVVVPVSKEQGRAEYESRIEFLDGTGKLLCSLDYSSEDSEHGFGVVKAAWTADSQYFVFSMTSSGGHQAWRAPTQFYSRKANVILALDDYVDGAGISNADFRLVAPNIVKTEIWKGVAVPVTVRLETLPRRSRTKPFSFGCAGGRVFKFDKP